MCERDHLSHRRTFRSSGCNKRQFCVTASTNKISDTRTKPFLKTPCQPCESNADEAEPTLRQRIKILIDKAAGTKCSELTLSEAHELSSHYHIAKVRHGPRPKTYARKYRCCFCLILQVEVRSFEKKCHLRGHYKSHLQLREECLNCGKFFVNEHTLRKHQKKAHPDTIL